MDIASTSTVMSQMAAPQSYEVKINNMVKDQTELLGQQVMQLLESTTLPPVDPSNPVGQVINTYA